MPLNEDDIERILVITAHPDDLDFGCSGTIATWTAAGKQVSYCICTNGDAGGFDPDVPRSEIAGIRQREQRAAAEVVGVTDIHFLGHPDGALSPTLEVRRDISRVIRQVRPQRVVCQSPDRDYKRMYASHPDHLAAGEAALCAVYPDARNPFAHLDLAREGHEAWSVPEVWMMDNAGADHAVDTTDKFPLKLAALAAHQSQTSHMPEGALEERLRTWNGELAERFGFGNDRLAEAFRIIDTQ